MPDVTHVEVEPERRRPACLRQHQRWRVQMPVALGAGPYGRNGHQMHEVEGVDDGLAHIRVRVARQAAEPGIDRV